MFQNFMSLICQMALYCSLAFAVLFSGNVKDAYYRDYIGDAVVRIYDIGKTGGGTGFHVEAESGEVFILTNNHICEAAKDNKLLVEKDGKEMIRQVVARYEQHDLCLIEAMPNPGRVLEIADSLDQGDDIVLIGHPGLRDLTLSKGEFIGQSTIEMPNFDIVLEKKCNGKWIEDPMLLFIIGRPFVCLESLVTSSISSPSYGGNSGSPVVNKYGNVVGVLFAGNRSQVNDSYMVPLQNVQDFLKGF